MATMPIPEELWTVEEYLAASWHPDREFVEGRVEERNAGEKEHSIVQRGAEDAGIRHAGIQHQPANRVAVQYERLGRLHGT
jgi:hypothetical protein